jgi:hypothetical protein
MYWHWSEACEQAEGEMKEAKCVRVCFGVVFEGGEGGPALIFTGRLDNDVSGLCIRDLKAQAGASPAEPLYVIYGFVLAT